MVNASFAAISPDVSVAVLFLLAYLTPPILLLWGWLLWAYKPKAKTIPFILSTTSLVPATFSATLAISTIAYAHFHPFPFYDPILLRIYRSGALLSLGGIILGLFGIRRPNSTRWHGPASAFAMLFFWIVAASGE